MGKTQRLGLEWPDLRNIQRFVKAHAKAMQPHTLKLSTYIHVLQGFGSKVLKKSGWREGSGVGASNQGISEPLEAEGQHPRSKKGLGYI